MQPDARGSHFSANRLQALSGGLPLMVHFRHVPIPVAQTCHLRKNNAHVHSCAKSESQSAPSASGMNSHAATAIDQNQVRNGIILR
jgi:hypothetical protein